jgi:hypothetical protein
VIESARHFDRYDITRSIVAGSQYPAMTETAREFSGLDCLYSVVLSANGLFIPSMEEPRYNRTKCIRICLASFS